MRLPFAYALFCFETILYFLSYKNLKCNRFRTCEEVSFVSVFQALILNKFFGSVFFLEPAIYEYSFLSESHVIAFR